MIEKCRFCKNKIEWRIPDYPIYRKRVPFNPNANEVHKCLTKKVNNIKSRIAYIDNKLMNEIKTEKDINKGLFNDRKSIYKNR